MRDPMAHPDQFPTCRFFRQRHAGWALACVLLCGTVALRAHADTPFSCPAPRSAARQKTAPIHEPSLAAGGKMDLLGDTISYGTDGNGILTGHVTVRQGQRVIQSDDAEYEAADDRVGVKGHVDYTDPLIHLTGDNGRYSTSGGASFRDATFELLQRDAH